MAPRLQWYQPRHSRGDEPDLHLFRFSSPRLLGEQYPTGPARSPSPERQYQYRSMPAAASFWLQQRRCAKLRPLLHLMSKLPRRAGPTGPGRSHPRNHWIGIGPSVKRPHVAIMAGDRSIWRHTLPLIAQLEPTACLDPSFFPFLEILRSILIVACTRLFGNRGSESYWRSSTQRSDVVNAWTSGLGAH